MKLEIYMPWSTLFQALGALICLMVVSRVDVACSHENDVIGVPERSRESIFPKMLLYLFCAKARTAVIVKLMWLYPRVISSL
jgi:hypothetical protein